MRSRSHQKIKNIRFVLFSILKHSKKSLRHLFQIDQENELLAVAERNLFKRQISTEVPKSSEPKVEIYEQQYETTTVAPKLGTKGT